MATTKITLNELRSIVKQIIKEEKDKLWYPIAMDIGVGITTDNENYEDITEKLIKSVIDFMKKNNSKLIDRVKKDGITYLEFDKDYRRIPDSIDYFHNFKETWRKEAIERYNEFKKRNS
jgi:hypothetical protein